MSETEATGVTDDYSPATSISADATIGAVEEAIGGAEKWVDGFQRTVKESTDSAIRSLRENSTSQFRSIQVYHSLFVSPIDSQIR